MGKDTYLDEQGNETSFYLDENGNPTATAGPTLGAAGMPAGDNPKGLTAGQVAALPKNQRIAYMRNANPTQFETDSSKTSADEKYVGDVGVQSAAAVGGLLMPGGRGVVPALSRMGAGAAISAAPGAVEHAAAGEPQTVGRDAAVGAGTAGLFEVAGSLGATKRGITNWLARRMDVSDELAAATAEHDKALIPRAEATQRLQVAKQRDQVATGLVDDVSQLEHSVRQNLDTGWQNLRQTMAGTQGNQQRVAGYVAGARKLVSSANSDEFEGILQNARGDAVEPTWENLRATYQNLGYARAAGNMSPDTYTAVKNLQENIGTELHAIAATKNQDAQFTTLQKGWSQYMDDFKNASGPGGSPVAKALRYPDRDPFIRTLTGAGADRSKEILGRWGGQSDLIDQYQQLGDQMDTIKNRFTVPPVPDIPKVADLQAAKLAAKTKTAKKYVAGAAGLAAAGAVADYGGRVAYNAGSKILSGE